MKWLRKKRTLVLTLGILIAALVGWSFWTSRPPKITFLKFRSSPDGLLMDLELENSTGRRIAASAVQIPYYQRQTSSGWVDIEPFAEDLKPAILRSGNQLFHPGERIPIVAEAPVMDDGQYPFPFRIGITYWRPNPLRIPAILRLFGSDPFQPTFEIAWSDPITSDHFQASSGLPFRPRE